MIRPSWLENRDQHTTVPGDPNQELLVNSTTVEGVVMDGCATSPVDSVQSKQILVVKTFRENAMDRFPSILKLT